MKKRLFLIACAAGIAHCTLKAEEPTIYAVSNAHLDTQWNWDVQATISDHLRKTLDQNIHLINQYPEYVFNFEGGIKYAWMKEYYPLEYETLRRLVKEGRWHISGASWDANDVNVPSVESQIRNIMLGQNFYRDEFGVESTDIFLPDCFGFGWTLPTIANHCGLIGFSSQKLGWRSHPFYGENKLPFKIGLWQGVDGSRIMMAHGYDYVTRWHNEDISASPRLLALAGQNANGSLYHYYGTGDTGGSPSIGSVEAMLNGLGGSGPLKVISAESDRLYRDYLPYSAHPELPVFDGELLMDVHGTGCYTSQAAMKLYNRQNELLGDAAERAAAIAELVAGDGYPVGDFTQAWRRFIWHQFHDDLTGTSIPRAYEFSWNDELLTLKQFADLLTDASKSVIDLLDTDVKGTPVVMFNPQAYERTDVVEFEVPASGYPSTLKVLDHNGRQVKCQPVAYENGRLKVLAEVTVLPMGYAVYDVRTSGKDAQRSARNARALENSVYSIRIDESGDIVSIVDKRNGKELVKDGRAVRQVIFPDNKSYSWPAWEILKSTLDTEPVGITDNATLELVEDGPLRKTVRITKAYGDSRFVQYISLYEGALADRIDFADTVDWASTGALLKAEFPLNVANETATYDLGIGAIERGNDTETAYEVPARDWVDLSDASGEYGVTILAKAKYGWDKPDDNTLRLSLIHTPQTRNNFTYQDRQDFGRHEFSYSLVGHAGPLDRAQSVRHGEVFNQPVKAFSTAKHKGNGRSTSLLTSGSPGISVKAFKKAEDGDGYVVRVYETQGKPASGTLTFSLGLLGASEADGTEKEIGDASYSGNTLDVSLPANGIATYRVWLNGATPGSHPSMPLDLPYNRKAMTWNAFKYNGDFSQGYSYAAELVPDTLESGQIRFTLAPRSEYNALALTGDTLQLPDGDFNTLHLLMAAADEDNDHAATFVIGGNSTSVTVPSYTGFVGQWGHDNHTEGYLKPQRIGHVGTHRHSSVKDEPYEFTYMFRYDLPIPLGVKEIVLPRDEDIVIFAASVSRQNGNDVRPAAPLFATANRGNCIEAAQHKSACENLLRPEMITGFSGYVNSQEAPALLVDGDENTKWCDTSGRPAFVDFDLGQTTALTGWRLVSAAVENPGYITSGCYLLGRNSDQEEWRTLDYIAGNKQNVVKRTFQHPENARHLRLMVTSPTQDATIMDTRIYELEVY